jgi:DNA-directed RNA polymerase specialized sigma subunit
VEIEGLIKKLTIIGWLENYEYLEAKDTPPDAMPGNSGPKSYDGVSASQLNKLMLDQAIDKLPKLTKAICKAHWVHKIPVKKTLQTLEISKSVYNDRKKQAVDLIYQDLNGIRANYVGLLDKITNKA